MTGDGDVEANPGPEEQLAQPKRSLEKVPLPGPLRALALDRGSGFLQSIRSSAIVPLGNTREADALQMQSSSSSSSMAHGGVFSPSPAPPGSRPRKKAKPNAAPKPLPKNNRRPQMEVSSSDEEAPPADVRAERGKCPFPRCPDHEREMQSSSLLNHIVAMHINAGQRVPREFLVSKNAPPAVASMLKQSTVCGPPGALPTQEALLHVAVPNVATPLTALAPQLAPPLETALGTLLPTPACPRSGAPRNWGRLGNRN